MKKDNALYALWLPSWYPSRVHPLNGDFIKRHAEATATFFPIVILSILKDPLIKKIERTIAIDQQLTEITIYYPVTTSWPWLESFFSFVRFSLITIAESKKLVKEKGIPSIIHVHILKKPFLLGIFLSKVWNRPLLFSEQQTDFLEIGQNSFHAYPSWKKNIIRFLLKQANAITAVSQYLANSIDLFKANKKIDIIPNVVNTSIFTPQKPLPIKNQFHLIHISTLNAIKNADQIIKAVEIANQLDETIYQLTIIGPVKQHVTQKNVVCLNEMPQVELAKQFASAHALILYSTYETFGCVTIEALASGRPVILSNIPVSYEVINEYKHGIIAKNNDPMDLARKIIQLKQHYAKYEPEKLSQYSKQKFSYDKVGKQFFTLYKHLIKL